ncbi:MAG: amidohydrolase family protein [Treponema sp.]|nr:amidohydrolase family protein [Treponema sp.]
MGFIDFHVHVTPPDIIAHWSKYAEKEPYFSLLSRSKCNKFAGAEDVIAALDKRGFERAVIFGFGFRDMGLCRYVNDYVIEKVRQYPQKFTGFISVAPCGDEAAAEIERCYNAGLAGVGELFPSGQNFDLEKGDIIFETCKKLRLPLLIHADEPVGHLYPGKTNVSLKQLEKFVCSNQSLKIVLAHWGGGLMFYETISGISKKFNNVYYDTAASPFLYDERIYNAAKALGLCEKILFGSDFPLLDQSRCMEQLEKSCISDEDKKLILGGNAQKLLGI